MAYEKKALLEEVIEHLRVNLTKGRSGKPGSGISSDWSILTVFFLFSTQMLSTHMRNAIYGRGQRTFNKLHVISPLVAIMKDQVDR